MGNGKRSDKGKGIGIFDGGATMKAMASTMESHLLVSVTIAATPVATSRARARAAASTKAWARRGR